VVVCVIFVNGVFIHNVGVDDAGLTVLFGFTVIETVKGAPVHDPDVGVTV
jgi:hypothetical protein